MPFLPPLAISHSLHSQKPPLSLTSREMDVSSGLFFRYSRIFSMAIRAVSGLEKEPERGGRCPVCFGFSLERTARKAAELKIGRFATSLTVSPLKDSKTIFAVGAKYPGFEPFDFKKKDGYRRSGILAGEYGLYRQNYCGCEFSIRPPVKESI